MDFLVFLEYMYAVAFVISMFLNSFLIYVIKKHSSRQMRVFSTILIQTTVVDMINSVLITATHLRIEATEGYVYITTGNSWLNLEGLFQCSYLLISAGICNVSFWSLPIQAIYRYISVARNSNVPSYFPTLLYMAITTLALTTGLPYYLYLTPIKGTFLQTTLDKMPFWANQDTNKFCAIKIMTVGPLLFCSYLATSQTFGFVLMIWSTLKLNKALQNAQVHLSSKTMAVHAQMTKKMLAQATLPGFIAVLLSTIIIVAIFNPVYDGGLYLLLFVPYPWVNVLNPILTLFCIHRYRNVVVAMVFRRNVVSSMNDVTKNDLSRSNIGGTSVTQRGSLTK